jgi:hypothetical protein
LIGRQARVQDLQTATISDLAFGDPNVAVPAIGFVAAIDDQALAEVVAGCASAEDLSDAVDRRTGLVSADVRLVGELPGQTSCCRRAARLDYGA